MVADCYAGCWRASGLGVAMYEANAGPGDPVRALVFMSQDRMLNAYTQMQTRFAGIKPNRDVRKPIRQTIKLLTIDIRSPVQDFRPTRMVANIVRKQER
jgi:hypothetical protein